jgi:Ca-activated chloride channel homolog
MRKISATFILTGLLCTGCSHSSSRGLPASEPEPVHKPQIIATASEQTSFPTASSGSSRPERTYFTPGATADDGVVVGSRQLVTENLGRRAGKDYVNEKQATNYMVSQAQRKNVPVQAPTAPSVSFECAPEAPPSVTDDDKYKAAIQEPLSTFSADVDTASFANVRREIQHGVLPRPELVRVEEMLNYFQYDLPEPKSGQPFSVSTELSDCPWSNESKLMRVAIKTKSIDRGEEPPRNLVFLLDVSGSMNNADKLPLLKSSLRTLVDTLDDNDRVAIVVYAGSSGLVLPSTTGDQKTTILEAIERLSAGGSTNGASGIQLAYQVAEANKTENSVNRVILATDGDFNVGISSQSALKTFIEEKRDSGLFLSVLGFGRYGNDTVMETLADNGNGNYASIDSLNEARKVLVQEAGATLITVAKDVKFQVAFDPDQVESYRLIGYKNRRLAARDFDDDTKDAGELGAGHAVTALYELRMKQSGLEQDLLSAITGPDSPATVKLRYKAPDADQSKLMEVPVSGQVKTLDEATADQQWAAAVSGYGMLLESELKIEQMPFQRLYSLMKPTMGSDPDAYQSEFYTMVKKTEAML